MFFCGGLLLFYVLQWTIDWLWGYFTRIPSELYVTVTAGAIALITAVVLYRNERVLTLSTEVAAELQKVAWPNAKEVRTATIVVIIMTIISAMILGLFDFVWSQLTQRIYG